MDAVPSDLIDRLMSRDIAVQIRCLDEILLEIKSDEKLPPFLKGVLIPCLTSSECPEFVAERLVLVAGQLVNELQLVLDTDVSLDAKFWAALLLLHVNVRSGIPLLLDAIQAKKSWYLLAVTRLAQINERSVIPLVLGMIRDLAIKTEILTPKIADEVASLLSALKCFDEPIPPDLLEKLSSESVPWQIRYELGLPVDIKKAFRA